jgi:hypothetical protein
MSNDLRCSQCRKWYPLEEFGHHEPCTGGSMNWEPVKEPCPVCVRLECECKPKVSYPSALTMREIKEGVLSYRINLPSERRETRSDLLKALETKIRKAQNDLYMLTELKLLLETSPS